MYKIIYFNYQSHITLHTTRPGPVSKQPCLTGMGRVGLCTGYAGTGLTARSRTRKDCVAWPWVRPVTNDALSACREPTWIWNRETVAANLKTKTKNVAAKFCSAQSHPDACIGRPRSNRRTAPPRPRRGLRFRFQDPPPRVAAYKSTPRPPAAAQCNQRKPTRRSPAPESREPRRKPPPCRRRRSSWRPPATWSHPRTRPPSRWRGGGWRATPTRTRIRR